MKEFFKAVFTLTLIVIIMFGVRELIFAQEDSDLLSSRTQNRVTAFAEREILSLLLDLRGIKLDTDLFQSSVFRSLVDFGVELEPQPVGRPNPFAPLGEDNAVLDSAPEDDLSDFGEFEDFSF